MVLVEDLAVIGVEREKVVGDFVGEDQVRSRKDRCHMGLLWGDIGELTRDGVDGGTISSQSVCSYPFDL